MAYPVTHILFPMILLDLYRRYIAKKRFSYFWVVFAGILGAVPDFDILLAVAAGLGPLSVLDLHRALTHSFVLVIPFLLLGVIFLVIFKQFIRGNKKSTTTVKTAKYLKAIYFAMFIIAFSVSTHILLDMINSHTRILYPFAFVGPHFDLMQGSADAWATLDAIMLCLWIILDERVWEPLIARFNGFFRH